MAERKDVDLDPAVRAILGEQSFKQQKRRATRTQRRELERQKSRQRITLELNPLVADLLRRIAEREYCSPASAANLLLTHAILAYRDRDLSFSGHVRGTDSSRWENVIVLDEFAAELENLSKYGF